MISISHNVANPFSVQFNSADVAVIDCTKSEVGVGHDSSVVKLNGSEDSEISSFSH